MRSRLKCFGIAFLIAAPTALATAQQLEPRAYSASPVGANFAAASFSNSFGQLLFDPVVPISDATASIRIVALGYGRTFAIGHLQGLVTAVIPYAWGELSGKLGASPTDSTIYRSGFGDIQAKVSLNIVGSPALTPQEFAKTPAHRFIFGASLTAVAPTGQYYPSKLINVGTGRWAFKPEVGASYNFNSKLYIDLYVGVWLFGDNTNFYPGSSDKSQAPLESYQLHVSYTFTRWLWVALESTYYTGGGTQVDGGATAFRQYNSRLGALAAINVTRRQSIKLSYSGGASARVGSNFRTVGVAYQVLWF
jgi:hypothetical protein